jgi:hypothetical protein
VYNTPLLVAVSYSWVKQVNNKYMRLCTCIHVHANTIVTVDTVVYINGRSIYILYTTTHDIRLCIEMEILSLVACARTLADEVITVHRRCPISFSWNDKAHVRVHWHVRACFASTQVDVDGSIAG